MIFQNVLDFICILRLGAMQMLQASKVILYVADKATISVKIFLTVTFYFGSLVPIFFFQIQNILQLHTHAKHLDLLFYCEVRVNILDTVVTSLLILPFLGLAKKPAVFRNGSIWREYNLKNPIWDLKWAAVLGGRRY